MTTPWEEMGKEMETITIFCFILLSCEQCHQNYKLTGNVLQKAASLVPQRTLYGAMHSA
jgi:hypothetical protein